VVGMDRGVEQRFDRIAGALPASDATIMRAEFHTQAIQLATAETQVRLSEQAVRDSLRAQPFDPAAVRTAMDETSQARNRFLQVVHETVASATAKMSPAGREALADWRKRRASTVVTQ
jgi:heavy-metal resistance protein